MLIALMRSAGVQSPIPQSEHEDIGSPKRSGREQEFQRRFFVRRQRADQEYDRNNQTDGENRVHGKPKNRIQLDVCQRDAIRWSAPAEPEPRTGTTNEDPS